MESGISQKTIISWIGVVIFLLIVASFPWWRQFIEKGISSGVTHTIEISSFDTQKIEQFGIKSSNDQKTFKKEGESWVVNGEPVLQTAIDVFFTSLQEITIQELASKNAENHERLQISEETGYLLTVPYKNKVYEYVIGTTGAQYTTFYIREKASNEVFLAKGNLRVSIVQPLNSWTGVEVEE